MSDFNSAQNSFGIGIKALSKTESFYGELTFPAHAHEKAMREIPPPIISVVAEIIANRESHATLENLYMYAGAPGDPPLGSKLVKAVEWLRRVNRDGKVDPLKVLGKLIEGYIDAPVDPRDDFATYKQECKEKIERVLGASGFQYVRGGIVSGNVASPSRSLEQIIRDRDVASVNEEFDRALRNVDVSPKEAVSAACNLVEAICKTYIEDEGLEMPQKQDLQAVWAVVRKDLGFDPSHIAERDLQEVLSGLIATVHGIGALRTHASTAHGAGRKGYKLESRHARLAVHAAHTVAGFIIESWDKKSNANK